MPLKQSLLTQPSSKLQQHMSVYINGYMCSLQEAPKIPIVLLQDLWYSNRPAKWYFPSYQGACLVRGVYPCWESIIYLVYSCNHSQSTISSGWRKIYKSDYFCWKQQTICSLVRKWCWYRVSSKMNITNWHSSIGWESFVFNQITTDSSTET